MEICFYSSYFNTTSFNWWMEISARGGQAKPENGNATSFNWWLFTFSKFSRVKIRGIFRDMLHLTATDDYFSYRLKPELLWWKNKISFPVKNKPVD